MKIQKLPTEVSSKLQSSIILTDVIQCVMELVYNSLDAESMGIAVRVDFQNYQIRVIDNGKGMKREDLELVGESFMTSKFQSFADMETSIPTYGYKGQTLSSLRKLCRTLRIETKSEENDLAYVKVFQNNKALPITTIEKKTGSGTSIFIDDFMYLMPVRRKKINEVLDLEEIKNQLQYLAIIHFRVCFTLRNENKNLIILQTPQASSILESIKNLYGKTLVQCLKPLHYKDKKYEISGYLSLKLQNTSNIQLIYVNNRIITKGVMHKFINNLIKKYSGKETLFSDSPTSKVLKNLKSTCNAFIIGIRCPRTYYELFPNARKTKIEFKNWKVALKCIHKALRRTYKDIINLESSSKSQGCDESKTETYAFKKAFGTSFLINVVKGAPAKREFETKTDLKMKKKVEKNDAEGSSKSNGKKTLKVNTKNPPNECVNDTMESPIPKRSYKINATVHSRFKETETYNQSFVEFYEWLKAKFKTDTNAFNLYTEFLSSKKKASDSKEVKKFESPVFKRKQISVLKEIPEKRPKSGNVELSTVSEQMAIMGQRQLKIFPSGHLRMKKAVHFTSKIKSSLLESSNFDVVKNENLSFEKRSSHSVRRETDGLLVLNSGQKQVECSYKVPSLPSSEAEFLNLIKFRNLSESPLCLPSDAHLLPEKPINSSTLNTWLSHCHNFEFDNKEFYERRRIFKNCVSPFVENGRSKNSDFSDYYSSKVEILRVTNELREKEALQDVEIQVNMSEIAVVKKVNAFAQTSPAVSKSQNLVKSYTFNQGYDAQDKQCDKINSQDNPTNDNLEEIIFQELPNSDYWKTLSFIPSNKANMSEFNSDINKINQKNSTPNEFFCGHQSISSSKNQKEKSPSKETQTLCNIWTDSLTKLEDPVNLDAVLSSKLIDSNLETTQLFKTIPAEQIECDALQFIESGFCLTERHDFVPKGLSPSFLNQDAAKISALSPLEKNRILLAICSTQNEFLANVKWQDELTGDCLKPIIPDGNLFEMPRKLGEGASYYENPVLSASVSYCAVKIHNLLHSFAFTKELLSTVEILGQLDKKFIVTKMKISTSKKMELISLFDQHAVDERIKLEELIAENILADGKFSSTSLRLPVHCVVGEADVRLVIDLKDKLFNFGLNVELLNETTFCVKEIPTFFFNKHEKNLKNKKVSCLSVTLKALIFNIVNEIRETRGALPKIPKIIHNAFCLEACHNAIKFNKVLSVENMTEMIRKLQRCKLPFQCAHGRPSVIPIIDLEEFKTKIEENEKVFDLQEVKKFFKVRKDF